MEIAMNAQRKVTADSRRRAFSYLRLSTADQLKGHGLARQLEATRKLAEDRGWDLQDELQDLGISAFRGSNISDGKFGQFLAAVRAGKVEKGSVLILESLDRMSRDKLRKSFSIFLDIINHGVAVATMFDGRIYEPDATDDIELMTSLLYLSRAHDESRTKSLRVGAAWAKKRENAGSKPLTAKCPGWLMLHKKHEKDDGIYVVREDRAKVVRDIFSDAVAGIGVFSIARRLNARKVPTFGGSKGWTNSYISKVLRSRAPIGEFQPRRIVDGKRIPDGEPIKGYFPRIIDDETFFAVQNGLDQRVDRGRGGAGRRGKMISNLFTGIAKCAYCGSPMRYENKGGKGTNMLVCDAARCGHGCRLPKRWPASAFEASFIAFVREVDLEHVVNDEQDAKRRADLEKSITALRGEEAMLERQVESTLQVLAGAGGSADIVTRKVKDLGERRIAIKAELIEREKEHAGLTSAATKFYEDRDALKMLIARLQGQGDDEEVYRLRSMIAARLRSLVSTIEMAPLGNKPLVVEEHAALASFDRNFFVTFVDGGSRCVYPDPADPLKVSHQVVDRDEVVQNLDSTGKVIKSLRLRRRVA
jgi:DNA invertase Pin-like site-specific DNA recombinase